MDALQYLNTSLPWTERIWKQLSQAESPATSSLFFGKQGLGKAQTALRYIVDLLSENDVFLAANHPDVHVIMPANEVQELVDVNTLEGDILKTEFSCELLLAVYAQRYLEKSTAKPKKIISVQQIRSLIEQITQHAHLAKNKIIVIKDADKMNINASNALLKTLEEPPENTIFILLADQIESLPITIRSRCTEVHFRSPDKSIGLQWLEQQGLTNHAESYLMMAGRAPLAALRLSQNNEIEYLRTIFSAINKLWAQKISSIELASEWKKHDFSFINKSLQQFMHDLLKLKSVEGSADNSIMSGELFYPVQSEWSKKISRTVQIESLFHMIEVLQTLDKQSSSPVDKQLLLEKTTIQLEKLALNKHILVS